MCEKSRGGGLKGVGCREEKQSERSNQEREKEKEEDMRRVKRRRRVMCGCGGRTEENIRIGKERRRKKRENYE